MRRAGRSGRPALTKLESWNTESSGTNGEFGFQSSAFKTTLRFQSSALSLATIQITTGRRHQIRLHTAYIGHPTVSDAKYTSFKSFKEDLRFCPRNFLHRFRLGFKDSAVGSDRQAIQPLPADLLSSLRTLEFNKRILSDDAGIFSVWTNLDAFDAFFNVESRGWEKDELITSFFNCES